MSRFFRGLISTIGLYLLTQGSIDALAAGQRQTDKSPQLPVATANENRQCLPKMSRREQEVVEALLAGNVNYKELSNALNISTNTVKTHLRHIYQIVGVPNITALLSYLQHQRIHTA